MKFSPCRPVATTPHAVVDHKVVAVSSSRSTGTGTCSGSEGPAQQPSRTGRHRTPGENCHDLEVRPGIRALCPVSLDTQGVRRLTPCVLCAGKNGSSRSFRERLLIEQHWCRMSRRKTKITTHSIRSSGGRSIHGPQKPFQRVVAISQAAGSFDPRSGAKNVSLMCRSRAIIWCHSSGCFAARLICSPGSVAM